MGTYTYFPYCRIYIDSFGLKGKSTRKRAEWAGQFLFKLYLAMVADAWAVLAEDSNLYAILNVVNGLDSDSWTGKVQRNRL